MKRNFTQKNKFDHISVATPVITASNSASSYEIRGTTVTLTCISTSDSGGSGIYAWKLDALIVYVFRISRITFIQILSCKRIK